MSVVSFSTANPHNTFVFWVFRCKPYHEINLIFGMSVVSLSIANPLQTINYFFILSTLVQNGVYEINLIFL